MIDRLAFTRALGALLVLATAACGSSPTTSRIVAAEGGTIAADTHTVTIPARSLATDTEITLETAPASGYPALEGARPEVLRILPEGTVLEIAATVTIRASFVDAAEGQTVSVRQLSTADGVSIWTPMESTVESSGDVRVPVLRFAPLAVVVSSAAAAGGIRGEIHWADHSPAASAPVQLFRGDAMVGSTTTSATGAFSFSELAAGDYRIVVDFECRLDRPVTVVAGETANVTLILCGASGV